MLRALSACGTARCAVGSGQLGWWKGGPQGKMLILGCFCAGLWLGVVEIE